MQIQRNDQSKFKRWEGERVVFMRACCDWYFRFKFYIHHMNNFREKWWTHGTLGCLLIGSGMSITLDAASRKMAEVSWEIWFAEGSAGYVVLISGLAFFGSAVRYMVLMDLGNR